MNPDANGKWYEGLYDNANDDSLTRGLRLLDALRPILPAHKRASVDKAKLLLTNAAKLYQSAAELTSDDSFDIMEAIWHMPPENAARLLSLCGALADFSEKAGKAPADE